MSAPLSRRAFLKGLGGVFAAAATQALVPASVEASWVDQLLPTADVPETVTPLPPDYTSGNKRFYDFTHPADGSRVLVVEKGERTNPTIYKIKGKDITAIVPYIHQGNFYALQIQFEQTGQGIAYKNRMIIDGSDTNPLLQRLQDEFLGRSASRTEVRFENLTPEAAATVRQNQALLAEDLAIANRAPYKAEAYGRRAIWKVSPSMEGFMRVTNGTLSETTVFSGYRSFGGRPSKELALRTVFTRNEYPDIALRFPMTAAPGERDAPNQGPAFLQLAKQLSSSGWGRLFSDAMAIARKYSDNSLMDQVLKMQDGVVHYALSQQRIVAGHARKDMGERVIPYIFVQNYDVRGVKYKGEWSPHPSLELIRDTLRANFGLNPADYAKYDRTPDRPYGTRLYGTPPVPKR